MHLAVIPMYCHTPNATMEIFKNFSRSWQHVGYGSEVGSEEWVTLSISRQFGFWLIIWSLAMVSFRICLWSFLYFVMSVFISYLLPHQKISDTNLKNPGETQCSVKKMMTLNWLFKAWWVSQCMKSWFVMVWYHLSTCNHTSTCLLLMSFYSSWF